MPPRFTIKNHFQKRAELYEDILTPAILADVCQRITGRRNYTVDFDDNGYNKGRLAKLEYQGVTHYISFSETGNKGRNSSFQSFPTALVTYHQEENPNKEIYFYFLPDDEKRETDYFTFMYRLMKTARTIFLNEDELDNPIVPFLSVSDLIAQRNLNRDKNRGNSSTFVTISEDNVLQIYGKTYGANKYETTLLCLAIFELNRNIELYEIQEGSLTILPQAAREVIVNLGISVITSDLTLERREFEANDSLRSPTYIFNLLEKLGDKKCSMCDCDIPQVIQGAHIWPVAKIKRQQNINRDNKLLFATNGDNGLWLCNNHHKLFDMHYLYINNEGTIKYKSTILESHGDYLLNVTINRQIPDEVLTADFLGYLQKRNAHLSEANYTLFD